MDHTTAERGKTLAAAAAHALEAEQQIGARTSGADLIAFAIAKTMGTQADLARLTGLTPNTITAIKRGKRATAAQRSAILWAIFRSQC
jgi:hypothetical protein